MASGTTALKSPARAQRASASQPSPRAQPEDSTILCVFCGAPAMDTALNMCRSVC